jgi:hypothetical protein
MHTLVIHPRDLTTDFLAPIYYNIPDADVVTHGWDDDEIFDGLEIYERVLMMGHGSPNGLFSVGNFYTKTPYVIGSHCADLLQQNENNVYIWCNADKFVQRYSLKGFFTGMFISEVAEATYCGVYDTTQDMVDESNNLFAEVLGNCINDDKYHIYKQVRTMYGEIINHNPVAKYNWKRLYVA